MLWGELIIYFQPEHNKIRLRKGKGNYEVLSETEMPMFTTTYPHAISLITVEVFNIGFLLY